MKKEYIIVGQGLVGSILGLQFLELGIPFKIYTNGVNHSTRVAAGLINPVVFKRLNKCFGADETIEFAYNFYQQIETKIGTKFVYKKDYCRIFSNIEEENNWISKQNLPGFSSHLFPLSQNKQRTQHDFSAPYGHGYVKNTGFLDTNIFLDSCFSHFKNKKVLVEENFDYDLIDVNTKNQQEFIFCEGYQMKQNPYFNYLPLNTTKGDVIDIADVSKNSDCIINKGVFFIPIEKNVYRIGSTYTWNTDDPTPTEKGKQELIEKLKSLDNCTYKIVKHKAGIRPTVKDRRPLIGTHPKHNHLHVINGMGTRGVALAPYWVDQFVQNIIHGKKLNAEVNISRFDNELNDK